MRDFTGIVSETALVSPPRIGPSLIERRIKLIQTLRLSPATSDRALVAYCGVSRELVAKIRGELVALGRIPAVPKRIGRDRKAYRQPRPKGGAK